MTRSGQHIGVDATSWLLKRGFGRHARGLLTALVEVDDRNRYTFFVDSPEAVPLLPPGAGVKVVGAATPAIVAASARGRRRLRDIAAMSRALSGADLDAVLFPTMYSFVPTFGRARRFVIVHDATAEMYPDLTIGGWKNRVFWGAKTALGRWQADVLVTVSEYSRDAIVQRYGVPAGGLHIVGEASDAIFRVLDKAEPTSRLQNVGFRSDRRSIVYVGGFSPHKGLDPLVRVFDRLASAPGFDDVDLYLVGDHKEEAFLSCYESLAGLVASSGLQSRVIFTGYLADEDLVVLLNLATVLVLPSLTEGLGLPALEAAACGCPVIATAESPLPGLLGDGGLYIDPRSMNSLESALSLVLQTPDLRSRMREAGLAAASRLTWHAAARRMVELLEDRVPA